jgi:putative acetyltransferase
MITVRTYRDDDRAGVLDILRRAFGGETEAELVEALRAAGKITHSLVAKSDGRLVGCIVFSPMTIGDDKESVPAVGLAPVAVLPGFQGLGIGSRLIKEGLDACRSAGHTRVIVLGHPGYYPRFGFVPASTFGISSTYEVPDDAFMACALEEGAFDGVSGVARYATEFDRAV